LRLALSAAWSRDAALLAGRRAMKHSEFAWWALGVACGVILTGLVLEALERNSDDLRSSTHATAADAAPVSGEVGRTAAADSLAGTTGRRTRVLRPEDQDEPVPEIVRLAE
jgi:hypothetical protein